MSAKSHPVPEHYDYRRSYAENYARSLASRSTVVPPVAGVWQLAGLRLNSPLGIAAGPLLNGAWLRHYAALGFDWLTYKTVRTRARASYPLPNLLPVDVASVDRPGLTVRAQSDMEGTWAVSFGMPSAEPNVWRRDIAATRAHLVAGQVLAVSVVGSPEPEWSIEELADDFALAAQWAVESGAQAIEANLSCPNVASADGQLYQQPALAAVVTQRIRHAIGRTPLLAKIGFIGDDARAEELIRALATSVEALVMVNCISARVLRADGTAEFSGEARGLAGRAIQLACVAQVRRFAASRDRCAPKLELVGVGGIDSLAGVHQHLAAGAAVIQVATAAMRDPEIALRWRRESGLLSASGSLP